MRHSDPVTATVPELPAFLYDGDCAFCSSCARFVDRWIPTDAPVQPWQWTDIDAVGVTVAEADEAVLWVRSPRDHTAGPRAIADLLLSSSRRLWRVVGRFLGLGPLQWVCRPLYRWIARNRHRMPGGTAQCSLPHAQRDLDR